jgi:amino acid transporter
MWRTFASVIVGFATLAIAIGALFEVLLPRLAHPDPIFRAALGLTVLIIGICIIISAFPRR